MEGVWIFTMLGVIAFWLGIIAIHLKRIATAMESRHD